MKGSKPENGCGYVTVTKGTVTKDELRFDGYIITYENGKVAVKDSDECGTPSTGGGSGEENLPTGDGVYFDPTGTVTDCKSGQEWTPTRTGTTCYKWNVVKDNGNTVDLLLDHNTTAAVAWSGGGGGYNNSEGPVEIMEQLKLDTSSWNKVVKLTSADNVTRLASGNLEYTIDYNGMNARLISAKEVVDIAGIENWLIGKWEEHSLSAVPWLYQNATHDSTSGYWTDTAQPPEFDFDQVWMVVTGIMDMYQRYSDTSFGVRPVIRVLKSNI